MADLISKTVRMPADIVAFVEAQEGPDFSKKLLGVLEDYRYGDANRQKRLQEYEAMLESKRRQLRVYGDTAYKASQVTGQLAATLCDIDSFFESIKQP